MRKVIRYSFSGGIILMGLVNSGEASLIDRGNGLIYDTDLDITTTDCVWDFDFKNGIQTVILRIFFIMLWPCILVILVLYL